MNVLNAHSTALLALLHNDLQRVVKSTCADPNCPPFILTETFRSPVKQEQDYVTGHSHAKPGQSAHNYLPALAFDFAPVPVDWNNKGAFQILANRFKAVGDKIGVPITWGGEWKTIVDMPHIELTNWREIAVRQKT